MLGNLARHDDPLAKGDPVTAYGAVTGEAKRRFGGLLRQRDFRLLWAGETVNQVGSAMALIGVPLLAVLFLHASTFEVGALAAAGYLPWLVIGLPAGAWVDRLPPRPVMVACDAASAALYASVPVAYAAGVLTIGQLLAVQLLAGAAAVVFGIAYQVNLPSLVSSGELAEGNAKLQASASTAALGGRGLSGLVTQSVGATASLVFNAASFVVSAVCLLAITAPAPRPAAPRQASTLRRDVAEGTVLVFRDPYLRPLTLFGGLANFALDALAALVVVFLVRVVGLGAGLTGLLVALPGVGGLLASFAARPVIAAIGSARGLLLATVGALPFALLVPLAGQGPRLVFYIAGTLVAATGVTMGNIITATFRQAYCPPGMLGRVTATMRFVVMGTSPFGALAGGALGTWLGPRDALWVVLSILAVSGMPLLSSEFTRHRDLPATPAGGGLRASARHETAPGERRHRRLSQAGADRPQVGKRRAEQGGAQVGRTGGAAGSGLGPDDPLDHLRVPVPPLLNALVDVDQRLAELGRGARHGVDVQQHLLDRVAARPWLTGVAAEHLAADPVPFARQVTEQRIEHRTLAEEFGEPGVDDGLAEVATAEHRLQVAELGGLEPA